MSVNLTSVRTAQPRRLQVVNWRVALLCAAAVSGWLAGCLIGWLNFSPAAVYVSVVALVALAPVLYRVLARRFDPFEPVVIFAVSYMVMFVVRPIAALTSGELVYIRPNYSIDVSSTFSQALLLAAMGAIGFVAGYIGFALIRAPGTVGATKRIDAVDVRRAVLATSLVISVGAAMQIAFVFQTGGIGSIGTLLQGKGAEQAQLYQASSAYLYMAPVLWVSGSLTLFSLGLRFRDWRLVAAALLLAGIVVFRAVPAGSRSLLLPMIGGLWIVFYLARSRRPGMLTLVAVAVVTLAASAVLLIGRVSEGGESRTLASAGAILAEQPSLATERIVNSGDTEMVLTLATALQVVPDQINYQYGRAFLQDVLARPVPRLWWADKPLPWREALIAELFPIEYWANAANPEFSILFFLYLDFSYPGAFFGMLALGIGAHALYRHFLSRHDQPFTQVFYAMGLVLIVTGLRESPADTIIKASFLVVPIIFVWKFSRATTENGSENSLAPASLDDFHSQFAPRISASTRR